MASDTGYLPNAAYTPEGDTAQLTVGTSSADSTSKAQSNLQLRDRNPATAALLRHRQRAQPPPAGSSVTGKSFKSQQPFGVGKRSDYDVAIVSPTLLVDAKAAGAGMRGRGTRTEPLKVELQRLGLNDLRKSLSGEAGRPVNFMVFRSMQDALAEGPIISAP